MDKLSPILNTPKLCIRHKHIIYDLLECNSTECNEYDLCDPFVQKKFNTGAIKVPIFVTWHKKRGNK